MKSLSRHKATWCCSSCSFCCVPRLAVILIRHETLISVSGHTGLRNEVFHTQAASSKGVDTEIDTEQQVMHTGYQSAVQSHSLQAVASS
jgi:hypothetical protein